MKTMTVGDFKKDFSQVVSGLQKGTSYAISYGKNKKQIGVVVPFDEYSKKPRIPGTLAGKANVSFLKDFKMTDAEFLNS